MNRGNGENELKIVSIRLVEDQPWRSDEPLTTPDAVLRFIGDQLQQYDRELFCVLNLSAKNQIISMNIASIGTLDAAIAHPRDIFKSAILSNARSIMLVHNHPSGNCNPSKEDIAITKQMQAAGDLLGIPVLDHIIVGAGQEFYSFTGNQFSKPSRVTKPDLKDQKRCPSERITIMAKEESVYDQEVDILP